MRFLVSLLLVLLVAQHAAASEVVFDYVGVPSNTSGAAALASTTSTFGVGGSEYALSATRFTLTADSQGHTLGAVVYGSRPDSQPLTPAELETVEWLVEVWDHNPGVGTQVQATIGNVYSSGSDLFGYLYCCAVGHTIVAGGFDTQWSTVAGTALPSYYIELDISDIFFESDVEYWISIRTELDLVNFGKTGTPNNKFMSPGPSDIWASSLVGGPLFPPYDGDPGDQWVYLSTVYPFNKWAYKLTVDPFLHGDHNGDGTVDAADYALWRSDPDSYGGAQGYTDWVDNFGQTLGSGSGSLASAAVPEPTTLALLSLAAFVISNRRVRRGMTRSFPFSALSVCSVVYFFSFRAAYGAGSDRSSSPNVLSFKDGGPALPSSLRRSVTSSMTSMASRAQSRQIRAMFRLSARSCPSIISPVWSLLFPQNEQ